MQRSLESLPQKLLLHIYSFLGHHSLTRLATVSKSFGALAETLIWTDIELHAPGYHESSSELKDPPPVVAPEDRRYHRKEGSTCQREYGSSWSMKAGSFFWMLDMTARTDLERAKALASRVRSLCTVLDWMNPPRWLTTHARLEFQWNIFPLFTNVELLELYGCWEPYKDGHGQSFDGSTAPLTKLRSLKLFGHLPQNITQYFLQSGPTLERLELGVLDAPVDSYSILQRRNPPPGWRPRKDGEDFDYSSDTDSLYGEQIAPRPLPMFPDGGVPEFPRLVHLHLCKPSMCDPDHNLGYPRVTYSRRAEEASLSDWSKLLQAAQGTVDTLVLEHRVVAEYSESDKWDMEEYILQAAVGPAEDHFMLRIMPVLQNQPFPNIRKVYTIGIFPTERAAGYKRAFTEFWDDRKVPYAFSIGEWCFFDCCRGSANWATFDSQDETDEESDWEGSSREQ